MLQTSYGSFLTPLEHQSRSRGCTCRGGAAEHAPRLKAYLDLPADATTDDDAANTAMALRWAIVTSQASYPDTPEHLRRLRGRLVVTNALRRATSYRH